MCLEWGGRGVCAQSGDLLAGDEMGTVSGLRICPCALEEAVLLGRGGKDRRGGKEESEKQRRL